MVCCWPMACCLSGLVCKGRLHICLVHVCACYVASLALLAAMAALAELARPMVITTSVHVRLLVQLHLSTCKYASVLPWPVLLSNIYMSIPLLWWLVSFLVALRWFGVGDRPCPASTWLGNSLASGIPNASRYSQMAVMRRREPEPMAAPKKFQCLDFAVRPKDTLQNSVATAT